MKLIIKKDSWCEADMHEMMNYPREGFRRKPELKAGTELMYDGRKYQNFYGCYYVVDTLDGTYHIAMHNADVCGGMPAWVAVDTNGKEAKHYGFCPKRHYVRVFNPEYPLKPSRDPFVLMGYWASEEKARLEPFGNKLFTLEYRREELEPGTVEKLLGRPLTFKDEPVQIE